MSIRGTVTIECDSKGCHAEEHIGDLDMEDYLEPSRTGLRLELHAHGWTMDDEGGLHCPECNTERDEAYERAAARARNNDFADTGGKDWT